MVLRAALEMMEIVCSFVTEGYLDCNCVCNRWLRCDFFCCYSKGTICIIQQYRWAGFGLRSWAWGQSVWRTATQAWGSQPLSRESYCEEASWQPPKTLCEDFEALAIWASLQCLPKWCREDDTFSGGKSYSSAGKKCGCNSFTADTLISETEFHLSFPVYILNSSCFLCLFYTSCPYVS